MLLKISRFFRGEDHSLRLIRYQGYFLWNCFESSDCIEVRSTESKAIFSYEQRKNRERNEKIEKGTKKKNHFKSFLVFLRSNDIIHRERICRHTQSGSLMDFNTYSQYLIHVCKNLYFLHLVSI